MNVNLPRSDQPLMKVTAAGDGWSKTHYVGRPYRAFEIVVPQGIDVTAVEVVAEPCDRQGKPTEPAVIVKPASKKVVPLPKPEPQPVEKVLPSFQPAVTESKPKKKKKSKRTPEVTPFDAMESDSKSQVSVSEDEHDAGRIQCSDSGWPQEPNTDDMLALDGQ